MTSLRIKLLKNLEGDSSFASGEIFGQSGELISEFDVAIGYRATPTELNLPPGSYLIRARLPSGQTVSEQIVLKQGPPTDVVLYAFGSEHEWLSWHHFASGEAAYGRWRVEEKSFLGASSGVRFEANVPGHPLPTVSLIVASQDGLFRDYPFALHDFQVISMEDGTSIEASTYHDENYTRIKVRGLNITEARNWSRAYIHASLGDSLQQIAVLPAPWFPLEAQHSAAGSWTEVLISRPSAVMGRSSGYAPPSVITSTLVRDPLFGSLINFFAAGDVKTASRLTRDLKFEAQSLLANPFAAAAGCYVLLASREDSEEGVWRQWIQNLSNWVDWLPDGAIIRGWILLNKGDVVGAQSWFVTAASRGVPMFTAGLRLLLRGLTAVGAGRDGSTSALAGALLKVRSFAAAVDPTSPFCTFYGSDPISPRPPWTPMH